jgi:hypothetical protein
MGEKRCVYSVLVRNPEGQRPFGRPRRRWGDPISHLLALLGARPKVHISRIKVKMDLQEAEYGGIDWIDLAQDWDR